MPVYVSDLLTATAAPVNAAPTSTRTWQWLRGSTAISGATSSTYTAVTADIGSPLAASQIETNVAGTATAASAPTEVIQAFDPIRLFSASEPGVWYDPNDISTLFKGPTPVAPVTTPGESVWLMRDKSRGIALGPELVTNGDFSSATGWTLATGATIGGGVLSCSAVAANTNIATSAITGIASGAWYQVTATVSNYVSGNFNIQLRLGGTVIDFGSFSDFASNGTFTFLAPATAAATALWIRTFGAGFTGTIDNVSVKELPGNHATQPTTASQPIYGIVPAGGRRNLLTQTNDLTNLTNWPTGDVSLGSRTGAGVSVTNAEGYAYIGRPAASFPYTSGTTYTFSATVVCDQTITNAPIRFGGGFGANAAALFNLQAGVPQRISISATATSSGAGLPQFGIDARDGVVPGGSNATGYVVTFSDPQLELGSTATPYQRVTTQYDVTEAGVASLGYLFFDGSGDFMSTGTITPGTDKAQVFTGVRKLVETGGYTLIAETSTASFSSDGSFGLFGSSTGATGYVVGVRATSQYDKQTAPYPAPVSSVLAMTSDLGGTTSEQSALRVNGVSQALTVIAGTSAGTGNFLAYPLYIGRRNGTNLPFNGHIHNLIVRFGPNLTAARISATESWVASKTAGVTL